ncbi:hypothetical protein [Pseudomonas sp. NKUCC02_KPG]|uniref:hypothetical protein n=1 Tax=Pseudomonas sp. NKUCC02_KPG TaxID=2842124 RepID=UPI001C5AFE46|nr:hypothetical protein [Pseudomonas sp. NKUCC02_KPG]MBW3503830.1 hypothetical protein [Pseudomonas sp. NKUCC02_KPG]
MSGGSIGFVLKACVDQLGVQGGLIANVVIGVYGKGVCGHDGKSIKSFLAYRSLAKEQRQKLPGTEGQS